ncbi:hypothetical protein C8Q77DRAFT_1153839 [Trametes polyzona]|nr:hypothetical protein C8Q77DRAFT_1153839 [Trametes polyzona]
MEHAPPNAATAKFQLALPSLLAPVAPHLAALHATRARVLYPHDADLALADTHCSRCGAPFLTTGGHIHTVRKKSKKRQHGTPTVTRVLRRSCRACGRNDDVQMNPAAGASAFPKVRDRARRKSSTAPHVRSVATPLPPSTLAHAQQQQQQQQQHAPVSQPRAPRPSLSSGPPTPTPSRSSSIVPPPSRSSTASAPSASAKPAGAQTSDPAQPKARPKKKAGLQSLLARNREKQEQEKNAKRDSGLSAFLQGL